MWLLLIMLAVYLVLIVLGYSGDFYDSNGEESNEYPKSHILLMCERESAEIRD